MSTKEEDGDGLYQPHTLLFLCCRVLVDKHPARFRKHLQWLPADVKYAVQRTLSRPFHTITLTPSAFHLDRHGRPLEPNNDFLDHFLEPSHLSFSKHAELVGDLHLAHIARRVPGLLSLDLRACLRVGDAGMRKLAAACSKLRVVVLSNCDVTSLGIKHLVRGCACIARLELAR